MVDLNDYFNPVCIESPDYTHLTGQAVFPHAVTIHTENSPVGDIGKYSIAIIGVPEGRNTPNTGSVKGPDKVREQLYKLAKIPGRTKIIDLGNMKQGSSFNDTVAGLTDILSCLLSEDVCYNRRKQCSHSGSRQGSLASEKQIYVCCHRFKDRLLQ
jgi:hypothetical protein